MHGAQSRGQRVRGRPACAPRTPARVRGPRMRRVSAPGGRSRLQNRWSWTVRTRVPDDDVLEQVPAGDTPCVAAHCQACMQAARAGRGPANSRVGHGCLDASRRPGPAGAPESGYYWRSGGLTAGQRNAVGARGQSRRVVGRAQQALKQGQQLKPARCPANPGLGALRLRLPATVLPSLREPAQSNSRPCSALPGPSRSLIRRHGCQEEGRCQQAQACRPASCRKRGHHLSASCCARQTASRGGACRQEAAHCQGVPAGPRGRRLLLGQQ